MVPKISGHSAARSGPIFGIQKAVWKDGLTLITPSLEDARLLVDVSVLADIATVEEAIAAQDAGADAVLSTLRGYTSDTSDVLVFEPSFISQLVRSVRVPVIAEGRILTPQHARAALQVGTFAVVVGSAITRPKEIAHRFVSEMERAKPRESNRKHTSA